MTELLALRRRLDHRLALLLAPFAVAGGVLADVGLDPAHRHVPLCPFHAATGWSCPLCGSLRAVDALAHGRVAAALTDNVLLVAALPVLAAWWYLAVRDGRAGRIARRVPRNAVLVVAIVATLFTVLRNLPSFPGLRPS